MGTQSRAKAARRTADTAARERLRELDAGLRARPDIAAARKAAESDRELQARWRGDYDGQAARLRAAGWAQAFAAPDGLGGWAHRGRWLQLIHSVSREPDGNLWGHVSLQRHGGRDLASWEDLRDASWAVYPGLAGVQVVAPASRHVNISEALHVWTCLTASLIPDFGRFGTI